MRRARRDAGLRDALLDDVASTSAPLDDDARDERDDDDDDEAEASRAKRLTRARATATVAALGAPLIFQYVSTSLSTAFQLSLVSRVSGARATAAFGLGNVVTSVTGHAAVWGLGSGVDTISAQANGMGRIDVVGETFARGMAVLWTLAWAPGSLTWWKSGTILRVAGVDAETAERVERFARWRVPGLFLQCATCVMLKTMLAMKRSRRVAALSVCTTPLKFIAPFFCIRKFRNLEGAAIGLTLVDIGTFSMYAVGFATSETLRGTLKNVRVFPDAFRDWWGYLRLAIPGMGMQCIEWWSWDFNTALAGLCADPTLELDAQAFLSNTYFFFYSWACVWSRGASTSVGNAVGAGKTRDAATLAASTAALSFSFALVCAMVFYANADAVFAVYTNDKAVVERLDALVPTLTWFIVIDAVQVATAGIIVGAGYQGVTTPILIVSYWVIGLPLAAYLAIGRPKLGLVGIWTGIIVSSVLHLMWNLVICFTGAWGVPFAIRWREAADRASRRLDEEEKDEEEEEEEEEEE